ncbi:hypothetical protein JCM15764A_20670 [Geotalea toluenoxydans]
MTPAVTRTSYRDSFLTVGPPLFLMALILVLGLWLPAPLKALLQQSAQLLEVRP